MANTLKIGSLEHKELLCRTFIDTHDPFKPAAIRWPDLDAETLARLKAMPVWNEATRTEAATAVKVQSLGDIEKDPLLAEAISLQGYEEARHAEVLVLLARHYGIPIDDHPTPEVPSNPTRAFLRTGYGECMDSFFAFGLFRMGERAQYFPKALVDVFETREHPQCGGLARPGRTHEDHELAVGDIEVQGIHRGHRVTRIDPRRPHVLHFGHERCLSIRWCPARRAPRRSEASRSP